MTEAFIQELFDKWWKEEGSKHFQNPQNLEISFKAACRLLGKEITKRDKIIIEIIEELEAFVKDVKNGK